MGKYKNSDKVINILAFLTPMAYIMGKIGISNYAENVLVCFIFMSIPIFMIIGLIYMKYIKLQTDDEVEVRVKLETSYIAFGLIAILYVIYEYNQIYLNWDIDFVLIFLFGSLLVYYFVKKKYGLADEEQH